MALANYTDLLASINGSGAWLHRADLSAIAPDWVTLCEATMNYGDLETLNVPALRTADQETTATLTCTANTQTVALPAAFLEMRKVYLLYSGVRYELIQAPVLPIRNEEASQVACRPTSYTVVGNYLYLIAVPDQAYQIVIDYYAKIPSLITNSTNWLMTKSPMCYLAGAIVHGAPWMGPNFNPDRWIASFRGAMWQVQRSDSRKRNKLATLRSEVAQITGSPFNIMSGT